MNRLTCMRHRLLPAVLIAAWVLAAAEKNAGAKFDFDNQLWMTLKLDADILKRLTIYAHNDLRLGNDVTKAAYFHSELGVKIHAHKIASVGVYYRQVYAHLFRYYDYEENPKKAWDAEFQPGWFATLTLNPGRVVIFEKVKLEIPTFENGAGTHVRFRHVTLVGAFIPKNSPRRVMAYIKNIQIFLLHPSRVYSVNRTYAGLAFPVTDFIALDVYIMWRREKRFSEFYDFFILGLAAYLKLPGKK